MIENFLDHKDKLAVFDDKYQLTYEKLHHVVATVRKNINSNCIGIYMQHSIMYLVCMLAAVENGATVFLLNSKSKKDSLQYVIDKEIVILTDEETKNEIDKLDYKNTKLIYELDYYMQYKVEDIINQKSAICMSNIVISTSGTTSAQTKFVKIPFNHMLLKARMIKEHLKINNYDVNYMMSPLCFVQSLWTVLIHLLSGASLYFAVFKPKQFYNILEMKGITTLITVPSVIRGVIDSDSDIFDLRLVSIGGDYMDKNLLYKLKKKWPCVLYANVYGATETCAADVIFDPMPFSNLNDSFFSLGKETEYSRVFILSDTGKMNGRDELGNICIQSPFLIDHYLNTGLPIRNDNGYFETYDKGFIDNDGRLHYVGRANSIIVYNGEKISACEVEQAIYSFGGIDEVVVLGKNHEIYGQIPIAFFVSKQKIEEQEVIKYLTEKLEKYKIPKSITKVPELKKTHSDKIIRNYKAYE